MSWMTLCDGAVTSKRACSAFFITREPSPFPAAPTSTLHSGSQLTDRAGIIIIYQRLRPPSRVLVYLLVSCP